MKSKLGRNVIYYLISFFLFILSFYLIQSFFYSDKSEFGNPTINSREFTLFENIEHNLFHPISILILQIIVVVFASRVLGFLFNKIKQPPVIGEVLAGIALGPSLLGQLSPEISGFLFPANSVSNLQFLSQIGLILFMFIIGMELDLGVFKKKIQEAVFISHTGIFISLLAGIITGLFLYDEFGTENSGKFQFALFMGVSMSITAFPVMARILLEKGYAKKPFGSMMITIAAVDDLTAWCMLAVVIAFIKAGSILGALPTVILSVVYLSTMFLAIRPFLKKAGEIYITPEVLSRAVVGFIFLLLLASSFITEVIGIHAFFGAFIAGVVMPPNLNFKKVLSEKIEDISLVLLLPLFFVYTGLRTEIGSLNSFYLWKICILVVAVSIASKFFGGMFSARLMKNEWKESAMVGVLMNTRGLIELVVLNIGYDLGIFSKEIFAIMVIMAIVTTVFTSPALDLTVKLFEFNRKKSTPSQGKTVPYYKILLSFGPSRMGISLLKIASKIMLHQERKHSIISALHLTPDAEITIQDSLIYEKESFKPIRKLASELSVKLKAIYKISDQIDQEILKTVQEENAELLLLGAARSLFTENKVGGRVGQIIENVNCNVGILLDKGLENVSDILVFYTGKQSDLLVFTLERMSNSPSTSITIINQSTRRSNLPLQNLSNVHWTTYDRINPDQFKTYDLIITGYDNWNEINSIHPDWQDLFPSVLILKTVV